jgi:DNA end-binding protein Ku
MTARAMWKAELCVHDQRVPVKLYAAVLDQKVHFRLLHAADLEPVQQQMVDPVRNQPVPKEQIEKAVEIEDGLFVVLTEDDQRELEPQPSREIRVEQVISPSQVNLRWFDRPYYLGPDGDTDGYFALAQVLAEQNKVGVARWVMRKKQYHGVLGARAGYLALQTLRHTEELLAVERVEPAPGRAPGQREQKLAEQLIATLDEHFDPEVYHDNYREQVRGLIAAKAAGRELLGPAPLPEAAGGRLVEQLRASLSQREAAGGR